MNVSLLHRLGNLEFLAGVAFTAASTSVIFSGLNKENNNPVRVVNGFGFLASNLPMLAAGLMLNPKIQQKYRQSSLLLKTGFAFVTMLSAGMDNYDRSKSFFENYRLNFRLGEFSTGLLQLAAFGSALALFHEGKARVASGLKGALQSVQKMGHLIQKVNGSFVVFIGASALLDGIHKDDKAMQFTGASMIVGGLLFAFFKKIRLK